MMQEKLRSKYNTTQQRVLKYLKNGIKKGDCYFKSRYIAKDLGLSSREVGMNLAILAEICEELEIIRWSYSNATTWLIRQQTNASDSQIAR
ncbi:MAG: hypothetical protein PWP08_1182 [Methanofollis sp.]|nr:hypothetical protein [Methanofollis sp.]